MCETIYTIGFAKKSLRKFINLLQDAGVTMLIDTRLNNTSQLAGFAKKKDLEYILELVGIEYVHELALAPTENMLKDYKNKKITWERYAESYLEQIEARKVFNLVSNHMSGETISFLCSEDQPDHCHRKILAEYIQKNLSKKIKIQHLV